MNKRQQQLQQIAKHISNLATLYKQATGVEHARPDLLNKSIRRIERTIRRETLAKCNGEPYSEQEISNQVLKLRKLFNNTPPKGLFINYDARGYALKIDGSQQIELHKDFGGNYILAPEY